MLIEIIAASAALLILLAAVCVKPIEAALQRLDRRLARAARRRRRADEDAKALLARANRASREPQP